MVMAQSAKIGAAGRPAAGHVPATNAHRCAEIAETIVPTIETMGETTEMANNDPDLMR